MNNKFVVVMCGLLLSFNVFSQDEWQDTPLCKVQICNKIERFSLSIMSHIKDSMGETCASAIIPKEDAVVGKELNSESRWYQGSSINFTKKSVTRVSQVYECQTNEKGDKHEN